MPFCRKACIYCDFHFSVSQKNKKDMLLCMQKEILQREQYLINKRISSIYFGGGTPSVLTASELKLFIHCIEQNFQLEKTAEITLEANPDDLNETYLQSVAEAGINRLSIGVQSFIDEELKWMNRSHSAEDSVRAVRNAQQAGFTNISIDLIYGSKFQSEKSWNETLTKAFDLNIQHLSSYNLTIEENTVLGRKHRRGEEESIDDLKSAGMFQALINKAGDNNFIHYEISNFAKEGYYAKHNSSYWKGSYYLGIGPGAHSYNGKSRQWNISNNSLYIAGIQSGKSVYEIEYLGLKDMYNEYILTRLRTIWGIDYTELCAAFPSEIQAHFTNRVQPYLKNKTVVLAANVYSLSREGKLLADKIASDLFL